jgi:hypothetical protein
VGLARPLEDSIFMKKFLVICLVLTVALAHADNSKLSPDLQASSASHASVVVQYNQGPRLLDFLNLANLLGTNLSDLPLVNGIVADFPLANVNGGSSVSSSKYFTLSGTSVAAGSSASEKPSTRTRSGESPPDEDGMEILAYAKQRLRSDHRNNLHRSVRRVHGWRRLYGCRSSDYQQRCSQRDCDVSNRKL